MQPPNQLFPTPLPTELTLAILSYLPLSTLAALHRVNRGWAGFLNDNEEGVYRTAAIRGAHVGERFHGGMVLEDLGPLSGPGIMRRDRTESKENAIYSEKAMKGVDGWKTFCKKRKAIALSWAGRAPSRILSSPRHLDLDLQVPRPRVPSPLTTVFQTWGHHPPPGASILATQQHAQAQAQLQAHLQGAGAAHSHQHPHANREDSLHYRRVHRIKVDEKVGISMATTQLGGLVVRDLETDAVLWQLPQWYVRAYAHLEYGEGYVLFDRDDGNKEVWRRTADISGPSASSSSPEGADQDQDQAQNQFNPASAPDERQRHVMNYISLLSPAPSLSHATAAPSASTSTQPNSINKAAFTPHAVLHMPEATRAYRFVYPDLLVASLDRAYVWDVRSARIIQCVEGIQVVQPAGGADAEHDNDAGYEDDLDHEEGHQGEEQDRGEGTSSAPRGAGMREAHEEEMELGEGIDALEEMDTDEDEDEDIDAGSASNPNTNANANVLIPQFLGLVQYVELSSRHLFFAGRYLLRVFSRETGKCVLDVPSSRWRYGKWRWEVASKAWASENGVESDSYSEAKAKGKGKRGKEGPREAVRVPVRFTEEDYASSLRGRMIVDQFVAVHVSSDGKHFVALLNGSRLVMIPHFEAFLGPNKRVDRGCASTSGASTSNSTSGAPGHASRASASRPQGQDKPSKQNRPQSQQEKDAEIFAHTLDIQLGAPSASNAVYLAFENGRVGVVTTNAVYIVIPSIPADPSLWNSPQTSQSSGSGKAPVSTSLRRKSKSKQKATTTSSSSPSFTAPAQRPSLQIVRIPHFSNPSWLSEVSCFMMSDTGLYLNWNSTWPQLREPVILSHRQALEVVSGGGVEQEAESDYEDEGEGSEGRDEPMPEWERGVIIDREALLEEWDREYENDLETYEQNEENRYRFFPNGDMFVGFATRDLEESSISTIYSVDFAPPPPEPAHVRTQVRELVMEETIRDGGEVHEMMEVVDEPEPEPEDEREMSTEVRLENPGEEGEGDAEGEEDDNLIAL